MIRFMYVPILGAILANAYASALSETHGQQSEMSAPGIPNSRRNSAMTKQVAFNMLKFGSAALDQQGTALSGGSYLRNTKKCNKCGKCETCGKFHPSGKPHHHHHHHHSPHRYPNVPGQTNSGKQTVTGEQNIPGNKIPSFGDIRPGGQNIPGSQNRPVGDIVRGGQDIPGSQSSPAGDIIRGGKKNPGEQITPDRQIIRDEPNMDDGKIDPYGQTNPGEKTNPGGSSVYGPNGGSNGGWKKNVQEITNENVWSEGNTAESHNNTKTSRKRVKNVSYGSDSSEKGNEVKWAKGVPTHQSREPVYDSQKNCRMVCT